MGGTDWIDMAQDRDRWRAVVKRGSETTDPIKCWEFLDHPRNCQLLTNESAPRSCCGFGLVWFEWLVGWSVRLFLWLVGSFVRSFGWFVRSFVRSFGWLVGLVD